MLGIIYSQVRDIDGHKVHRLEDMEHITSVIADFQFFAQEKYRIASDRPGSGNTKNIGSVLEIERLISGTGPFAELGEEVFDDYWMFYLTQDMARAAELPIRPYVNLKTYKAYKSLE
ncbi:MAG: EcoRV family type II restriction endonuclease [Chloroflexi bacterium]|nr:EcoRV family type II restriction endonuclease [Chloroflexota bacterium]MCI0577861.1 EcoRV family type II restriction endonuclease [Chloroflexota bacterium]MCI0644503.1 EcoRV family type II restriction endonuclease [Chloroflexota bacterium]MCI0730229.1 EcoRV family type II restriction endonuclease [Chloroflexota bacterium]